MKKIIVIIMFTILFPVCLYSFLAHSDVNMYTFRKGMTKCKKEMEFDPYFSRHSLIKAGCTQDIITIRNKLKQKEYWGYILDCRNQDDIKGYVIFAYEEEWCEGIRETRKDIFK